MQPREVLGRRMRTGFSTMDGGTTLWHHYCMNVSRSQSTQRVTHSLRVRHHSAQS